MEIGIPKANKTSIKLTLDSVAKAMNEVGPKLMTTDTKTNFL